MRLTLLRCLLLLLPLGITFGTRAQTSLVKEDFNTAGETTRYTTNAATINTQLPFTTLHYFMRATDNPPKYPNTTGSIVFGTATNPAYIYSSAGVTAPAGFWAAEGVRDDRTADDPGGSNRAEPGYVMLNPITVTNYTSLKVSLKLAYARGEGYVYGPGSATPGQSLASKTVENDDKIRIEYSMDNGAWTTVGLFAGDDPSPNTNGNWRMANTSTEVAIPGADILTATFKTFTYNIPTSGNSLRVRVVLDQRGSSEEAAFDDIEVVGTVSTVPAPGLAGIENTDVNYTEGQAAVQITNSIVPSGTITGATIEISAGLVSSQDVLAFTPGNGISGTYTSSTGILALTGTATAEQYQAALRSVTYRNTNTVTAQGGRRTIRFSVVNGAVSSPYQTRDVVVTPMLSGPAAMPYTEDFTTDGEGTRYASNTYEATNTQLGWFRTNANPNSTYTPVTFGNVSNGYYWYGEGTNNSSNPDPAKIGYLETQKINATGYTNLHYQVRLATGQVGQYEPDDYVKFFYRVAGGSWTLFGAFYGNASNELQRDTDLDGAANSGATTLNTTLTNVDFVLPTSVTGIIDFRTELSNDGQEEFAMDLIQVTGTLLVAPTVTTATPTGINTTGATLGGNVTADGGASVTERGVVYSSTNPTPTIGGSGVTRDVNGTTGTGAFSKLISGLTPGTSYSVAAYATNSVGTSYGSVITFTTLPNAPVLTTPANGTLITTRRPTYSGTAQAGSTVTVYVNSNSIGTTTATGGTFSLTPTTDQADGNYSAYATATVNGTAVSASSNTNSFTIDATAPTVVSLASTAGASGGNTPNSPIPFTVTFSESVTGLSASGISVTNGSVTGGPTGTGSGPYSFSVTPNTPFTVTTVQILANAVQDRAGFGNSASTTYSLTYQPPVTAAPVLNTPPNNGLVNTRTPTYTGTAPNSSTVTVYVNGNSVGTTTATGGAFSLVQPTALPDGAYSVSATAQGNGQQVSASSNTNSFTVDATAPTVSSVSVPANATYRTGQPLSFTVVFSEAVTVTGTPQLGLTIGTTTRQASYTSGSGSTALVFRYTVQAGDLDADGIALASALALNGGGLRDAATNDATLTLNGVPATTGVLVDAVAPTVVSSNRQNPSGTPTNATALIFRVTFSEGVNGVTTGSFALSTLSGSTTGTIASVAAVSGSPTTYDVIVSSVSGNGSVRLDVKSSGSGITDAAGNDLSGGFTSGQTFTIDQTAPSVLITSSGGASGSETPNKPISFTATFSENVTGFTTASLSVSNGTVSNFTPISASVYSFSVTPTANGVVTVNVSANVAQDAAGNGNTAATPFTITYRPPVTLTGLAVLPTAVCAGSLLTITATVGQDAGTYNYTLTVGSQVFYRSTTNAFSQTLTAQGTGSQSVSLRVGNGVDAATQTTSVQVNPLPTVMLANNGPITCTQPSVTLTATGNGMGQALTYRFSPTASQQGGSSGNTAIVTMTGDYSVTATTSGGCSATATTTVTQSLTLPTPTLQTSSGQNAVTVDLNSGNVTLLVGNCSGSASWTASTGSTGSGTSIVVPTNQAGRFVYQTTCQVGTCTSPVASATVTVTGRLTVLHRDVDNYADNNAIQPLFQLQNQGAAPLSYSALTLRYYVTVEGNSPLSNLLIDYAQVGNQNVRLRYVPLTPAQTGAQGYVEVSFTAGAGELAAGANSGNIKAYFAKADYGSLNELDDYSYATVRDQLVANLRITAYYNGVLIAGIEPGGGGGTTPPPTVQSLRALTESKNGPSATQINTFLEVRNEGTSAVNYSDLKVRYYFTKDGNERLLTEIDEGNVQGQLVSLNPALSGADTYLELSFTQGGQLAAGASTGRIRYRISKPDGGRFDQTNDYSYQAQPEQSSQNPHVVVLVNNQVVWGTLPGTGGRVAASTEPGSALNVRLLGNPLTDGQLQVEITGAQGQPLRLSVSDLTGRLVNERQLETAGALERQGLDVSRSAAGVLLLQVSTPTQSQTVKVIKAQ